MPCGTSVCGKNFWFVKQRAGHSELLNNPQLPLEMRFYTIVRPQPQTEKHKTSKHIFFYLKRRCATWGNVCGFEKHVTSDTCTVCVRIYILAYRLVRTLVDVIRKRCRSCSNASTNSALLTCALHLEKAFLCTTYDKLTLWIVCFEITLSQEVFTNE